MPQENLHVTLAFLDDRSRAEASVIAAALAEAVAASDGPIRLEADRYRETESVGMLVLRDEQGRAAALAGALRDRLAERGVEVPEHRPWLPHVTVLRYRVGRPRLEPALPELGPLVPSDAALYHSMLRSGGAQYDVVDSFALGGNH